MKHLSKDECKSLIKTASATLPQDQFEILEQCLKMENKEYNITDSGDSANDNDLIPNLLLAYGIILLVTAILGILGNLAVTVFYGRKFKELSPWKFLILHLACCDLLFSVMQMLIAVPSFTSEIGKPAWQFGLTVCKISRAARVLGSLIATQNIMIIAVERYKGILNPLGQHIDAEKRVKIALIAAWIFGLASCIPIAFVAGINSKEHMRCADMWKNDRYEATYHFYLLVVFGILPLIALTYLYGCIIRKIQHPKEANAIMKNMTDAQIQQRRISDMRIIKMLITVVVLFFMCVLPSRLTEAVISVINESKLPPPEYAALLYVGYLTYPLHVAINPFIYSFMNKEFRRALIPRCSMTLVSQESTQKTGSTSGDKSHVQLFPKESKEP